MKIKFSRKELIKKKGIIDLSSIEYKNCESTVNKASLARTIFAIKKIENGGKQNE